LVLSIFANPGHAKGVNGLRRGLQGDDLLLGETEAPQTEASITEAPTPLTGTELPTKDATDEPTDTVEDEDEPTDTVEDEDDDFDDEDEDEDASQVPTAAPSPTPVDDGSEVSTAAPTISDGGDELSSPPTVDQEEVEDVTPEPTSNPTEKPSVEYVATDDDPIDLPDSELPESEDEEGDYEWNDSNLEDIEHDRTVLIALASLTGVGLICMVITAQQMLENPDGICASLCRIWVACVCAIWRCICFPCRKICCSSGGRSNQDFQAVDRGGYTHDLELS